jgi:hypothetical protein
MRNFIQLLLALALASCANVPSDYKFNESSSEGLIVGSITYDTSIGLYALVVVPSAGSIQPRINVGYAMWPPLGPLTDDALKVRGGTFAVAVPAGRYEVIGWQITQGYKITRPTRPVSIPFTVEKGKASYLGNLHFDEDWKVALRDRSERDLPILMNRYDSLKTAPLAFTIAKGVDIQALGGDYDSRISPPGVIFIPIRR